MRRRTSRLIPLTEVLGQELRKTSVTFPEASLMLPEEGKDRLDGLGTLLFVLLNSSNFQELGSVASVYDVGEGYSRRVSWRAVSECPRCRLAALSICWQEWQLNNYDLLGILLKSSEDGDMDLVYFGEPAG